MTTSPDAFREGKSIGRPVTFVTASIFRWKGTSEIMRNRLFTFIPEIVVKLKLLLPIPIAGSEHIMRRNLGMSTTPG
jgi:hypothetical protein